MKYPTLALVAVALMLSACFKKDTRAADDPTGGVPGANATLTISGSPQTSIRVGENYSFTPSASDLDGDALTFTVANKPGWANFDAATGRLTGTPRDGDVGMTADIRITVSDGKDQAALDRFSITVNQISPGSATLSWMPPTQNADGTVLTNLSGYKIYYGRSAGAPDQMVKLDNPGLTRYVIENLSPGTWYFAMTSYNSQGVESNRSAAASKSVG